MYVPPPENSPQCGTQYHRVAFYTSFVPISKLCFAVKVSVCIATSAWPRLEYSIGPPPLFEAVLTAHGGRGALGSLLILVAGGHRGWAPRLG